MNQPYCSMIFGQKRELHSFMSLGCWFQSLIVRTCIYIVANITVFIVICITIIDTYFLFPNYSHAIFMCYKFPQVICVFDYTCIRKKKFYSVCVKSNFFYTALSLSKHQVHNSLLQTGIFLQLTFPRIAFNNTPSHSSNFAA